jgi:hypothetical protein
MDESGVFRRDLLQTVFRAGLDGHRDPRGVRRIKAAASSNAILAVEELSAVDPSAGVIVDVQNTIVQQRAPASGRVPS